MTGGNVFGISTEGMTLTRLREMVTEVKQMVLGRGYKVHSYVSLSGMSPIMGKWNDLLGSITNPGLSCLAPLVSSLLKTRASNDLSLKTDRERYQHYLMAVLVLPTVICAEVAELRRRPVPASRIYLSVRAGEKAANVFLPLQRDFVNDLVLQEDPVAAQEGDEVPDPGFEGRIAVKAHKFEATKIASPCCGTPMALFRANELLGGATLLYHSMRRTRSEP